VEIRAQRVGDSLAAASERLQRSGSETARLDAEVLLAYVLGIDRSGLAAHPEAVLSTAQIDDFESCVRRRAAGEPVAYIRGMKEFYGAAMAVDPRVLIPRPETETLVELALIRVSADLTSASRDPAAAPYLVWDLGTGSGAIAVAVAMELRRRRYGEAVRYLVSDVSADARDVATVNVVSHGLADLFTFSLGDLTDIEPAPERPVNLLLANLPYIPSPTMPALPIAASFEPAVALDGGPDGLSVIRRLLPELPRVLTPAGACLLEIGGDQGPGLGAAVEDALPGWACTIHSDLSGSPRVALVERADG
jgi:release factor glutamine methyltransferase